MNPKKQGTAQVKPKSPIPATVMKKLDKDKPKSPVKKKDPKPKSPSKLSNVTVGGP